MLSGHLIKVSISFTFTGSFIIVRILCKWITYHTFKYMAEYFLDIWYVLLHLGHTALFTSANSVLQLYIWKGLNGISFPYILYYPGDTCFPELTEVNPLAEIHFKAPCGFALGILFVAVFTKIFQSQEHMVCRFSVMKTQVATILWAG